MSEQDGKAPAPGGKNQGEGNYDASRRFDADERDFIAKNRDAVPKLAKDAEDALDGPEGEALRAAGRRESAAKEVMP